DLGPPERHARSGGPGPARTRGFHRAAALPSGAPLSFGFSSVCTLREPPVPYRVTDSLERRVSGRAPARCGEFHATSCSPRPPGRVARARAHLLPPLELRLAAVPLRGARRAAGLRRQ